MSIKIAKILCSQSVYLLKLNHPIDLMNLPTIPPIIKLNKCPSVCNWLTFGSKLFWICHGHG